jgi:hypothetical protein
MRGYRARRGIVEGFERLKGRQAREAAGLPVKGECRFCGEPGLMRFTGGGWREVIFECRRCIAKGIQARKRAQAAGKKRSKT